MEKYCVIYLKHGTHQECRTPWFYNKARARQALQVIQRRWGERNAVLYID
jgi:hypothetical protein